MTSCATCAHMDEDRAGRVCASCNQNEKYVNRYKEHPAVTAYRKQTEKNEPDAGTPDPNIH